MSDFSYITFNGILTRGVIALIIVVIIFLVYYIFRKVMVKRVRDLDYEIMYCPICKLKTNHLRCGYGWDRWRCLTCGKGDI